MCVRDMQHTPLSNIPAKQGYPNGQSKQKSEALVAGALAISMSGASGFVRVIYVYKGITTTQAVAIIWALVTHDLEIRTVTWKPHGSNP